MDKILDVIKEKLESPILMNYFIGLMLFNRKVIYAALSTDYNDRVSHFYLYNKNMYSSKVEMLSAIYKDDLIFGYSNVYCWPVVYAVLVSIALPYLKSVSNAVHENADKFYEWFRVWLNNMKTVSEERYNSVNTALGKALTEAQNIENENNELKNENSRIKEQVKGAQVEIGTSRSANTGLNSENEILKGEILQARNNLRDSYPPISIILEGIWKADFRFDPPSVLPSGTEYFKILFQCELHTSTEPYGEYKLRCFIDRYQFMKDGMIFNGKPIDRIKFQKSFVNENGKFDGVEQASCDYLLFGENKDKITGEEIYTKDSGGTNHLSRITITKYIDETLASIDFKVIK
jgi:hypothetical protein